MSLEKWAEYGWLKPEATSRDEIRSLLTIVERDLKDANVAGLSEDRRFEAAFSAARTSANIALRASGYRTAVQAGHHLKTIESLELTIKADAKVNSEDEDAVEETERHQLRFCWKCFQAGIGSRSQDGCRVAP